MYASIDLVMAKLERQIRRDKGAAESKRRGIQKVATVVPLTDGARPKKASKAKAKTKAKTAAPKAGAVKRAR
jgi:hypothetical protein